MQDNSTKQDLSILPKKDIQNVDNNVNNETNTILEESSNLSPSTTHTHTVHSTVQYSTGTVQENDDRISYPSYPSYYQGEGEGEEAEVYSMLRRKWRLS